MNPELGTISDTAQTVVPVILCGGKGTRLWPMSRTSRPKQFLPLTGEFSLFQLTLQRLVDPTRYAAPLVITNEDYRFLVAEQAQEVGIELAGILLEPFARNTAPAIAASAAIVAKSGTDRLMHVLPSDHAVDVDAAYLDALDAAIATARENRLVTFGVTPTEPATGFGYIEAGEALATGARKVNRFVEKPDTPNAQSMIDAGNFYWNSGMFLFSAQAFLDECLALAPEVHAAATASVAAAQADLDFTRLDATAFERAPDISVDYAIFEKTDLAAVVPAPIVWSDLGSWDAVWKGSRRDGSGNVTLGPTRLSNTRDALVLSQGAFVAVDGLEDVTVIASEDAVYVGRLSSAQNVGAIVAALKQDPERSQLTESHVTSYRPWGGYTSVLAGERFQVKRLFVKPGKRLSLQKHHHRAEHWVVVKGTAEVQVGEDTRVLRENESVYIPQGAVHRLSNPGKILLELIEVQTGSYLGEDDIIRLQDEFGRT